ncbi:MAG: hypothetical protein AAGA77_20395, partial [Bacteroidota bacterium]
YKFGAELEYVFPYNNGKWSMILEPSFVQISQTYSLNAFTENTLDYKAIQVPIGIRFKFLNFNNYKVFLNLVHAPEFEFGSTLDLGIDIAMATPNSFLIRDHALGLGVLTHKINFEVRYHRKRKIWPEFGIIGPSLDYGVVYFLLGYQLF